MSTEATVDNSTDMKPVSMLELIATNWLVCLMRYALMVLAVVNIASVPAENASPYFVLLFFTQFVTHGARSAAQKSNRLHLILDAEALVGFVLAVTALAIYL